jgi:predicted metal-binding membrane protein
MATSTLAPGHRIDGPLLTLHAAVVGAWSVIVLAEASGVAPALHHHVLIENGPPIPIAIGLFVVSWLVMVVAMMLPASLGAIREVTDAGSILGRPWQVTGAFVAGFVAIWSVFGLSSFLGDMVLHHVVDATPWLGARPWLIEASILALAGVWQFAPVTRHSLMDCRRAREPLSVIPLGERGALRLGLEHGVTCLGASWALMLLMFAEGFDGFAWMVALTVLMTWQVIGRDGSRLTTVAGFVLLLAALGVMSGGGIAA